MYVLIAFLLVSCQIPWYSCNVVVTFYDGAGCSLNPDPTPLVLDQCTPDTLYPGNGILISKTTVSLYTTATCSGAADLVSQPYTNGTCGYEPGSDLSFIVYLYPDSDYCSGSCDTHQAMLLTGRTDSGSVDGIGLTTVTGEYPFGSVAFSDGSVGAYASTAVGTVNGYIYFTASGIRSFCTYMVEGVTLFISNAACYQVSDPAPPCTAAYTVDATGTSSASFIMQCPSGNTTVTLDTTQSVMKS